MNKVIISGNITREPELSYTTGEKPNAYTRFSVACTRRFKNADGGYDVDFPGVIAWGAQAEFINKYFHKGDRIEIVGELRTGSYTKDGVKVYTTDVHATEVGFGGGKRNETDSSTATERKPNPNDFMAIPDDDDVLPFN